MEWLEGTLVDGKEDKEAWRLMPLELAVVPLVDGRYVRLGAIMALSHVSQETQVSQVRLLHGGAQSMTCIGFASSVLNQKETFPM